MSPAVTRVTQLKADAFDATSRYIEHARLCESFRNGWWCGECRALDSDARAADWRLAAARRAVRDALGAPSPCKTVQALAAARGQVR